MSESKSPALSAPQDEARGAPTDAIEQRDWLTEMENAATQQGGEAVMLSLEAFGRLVRELRLARIRNDAVAAVCDTIEKELDYTVADTAQGKPTLSDRVDAIARRARTSGDASQCDSARQHVEAIIAKYDAFRRDEYDVGMSQLDDAISDARQWVTSSEKTTPFSDKDASSQAVPSAAPSPDTPKPRYCRKCGEGIEGTGPFYDPCRCETPTLESRPSAAETT